MKSPDWIIAHDATGDKAYSLECLRCGAVQSFTLPVSLYYWVDVARVFEKAHRKCREKANGS